MSDSGYKLELESLHWMGMDYMSEWLEDILWSTDKQDSEDFGSGNDGADIVCDMAANTADNTAFYLSDESF
jgi:hypothetical protein